MEAGTMAEPDSTNPSKFKEDDNQVQRSNASSTVLPLQPCEICKAPSSGYHFGVISCEACKSFFRRTMKQKLEYTCLSRDVGQCNLRQVKGERPPCPACRFNKCVSLGMSLDAAKKGRYSHAKRVETARAAAQFWKEQQPDSESKQELETQAGSSEIIDTLQKTNPQGQSEQTFDVQREQLNGCVSENSEVCKPTKIECLPENASCSTEQEYIPSQGEQLQAAESSGTIEINRGFAISTVSNTDRDAVNDETQSSSSADDTQIYPLPSIELVRFFNESLPCDRAGMNKFTEIVTDAYDRQNFLPKPFLAQIPLVLHNYLVEEHCKNKKHPKVETVSAEHHQRVFCETGVDLDGRMEKLAKFINDTEINLKKIMAFCLRIPGFRSLSGDDRMGIIKQSRLETILITLYPVHFFEEGVCVLPSLKVLSKDFLMKVHSKKVIDFSFSMSKHLQDLYFNERENALFAALIMMNPDYCLSEEGKATCRNLRQCIAQSFGHTLKKRLPEDRLQSMFDNILQIVDDISRYSRLFNKEAESLSIPKIPGISNLMAEYTTVGEDTS